MKQREGALVELLQLLPTQTKVLHVEELLQGKQLCELMAAVVSEEIVATLPINSLLALEQASPREYFQGLLESLEAYLSLQEKSTVEIDVDRLVEEDSTHELYRLLRYEFRSLQQEERLISTLQRLSEQAQMSLMKVFQQATQLESETRQSELLNQIDELESALQQQEEAAAAIKGRLELSEQEQERLRAVIEDNASELEHLHARLETMEEVQQQLTHVSQELEQETDKYLQLMRDNAALLKSSQEQSEKAQGKQASLREQLERKTAEVERVSARLQQLEELSSSSCEQDKYLDIKQALTERCGQLMLRMSGFEATVRQLTEQSNEKDDELFRLRQQNACLEDRLLELQQQREHLLSSAPPETRQTPRYLDATLKEKPPSEMLSGVCIDKACAQKIRSLESIRKQYSQLLTHVRSPNQEYVTDCHRIIDEKTKLIEEYQRRLSRAVEDNRALKEKLIGWASGHATEQAVAKLKQKNVSMKKSVQELQAREKQWQLVEAKYQELKKMYALVVSSCNRCPTCARLAAK